jgi:hypothetical protein
MTSAGSRFSVLTACFILAMGASCASPPQVIRVWTIGSPHTGDTPDTAIPPLLRDEFAKRDLQLHVEAMPAESFAGSFTKAIASGAAPDVIVVDNYGHIDGITTKLGRFAGIGEDARIRAQLVRITESFDGLLGRRRGWVFVLSKSRHYQQARDVALRSPVCRGASEVRQDDELLRIAPHIATAYLTGEAATIAANSDPDRIVTDSTPESATVHHARVCATSGTDRLAFVSLMASYESPAGIGHAPVLLVFRKVAARWRLLVASRDPISNRRFADDVRALSSALRGEPIASPLRVILRSPSNGQFPQPADGQRFGDFVWEVGEAQHVVADIAEFAYNNDARLFVVRRGVDDSGRISSGSLWQTKREWQWRVWSLNRAGDLAFSEVRTFLH